MQISKLKMIPISSSILDKVGTIQNDKMTNVILRRKPKDPCLTAGRSTGFFSASRRIRMTTQLSILSRTIRSVATILCEDPVK